MVVAQGEVWWAELPDPSGSGPGCRRPVVVVQGDPPEEPYNLRKPLTDGAPPGVTNDEEWMTCDESNGASGSEMHPLDWAYPGKNSRNPY